MEKGKVKSIYSETVRQNALKEILYIFSVCDIVLLVCTIYLQNNLIVIFSFFGCLIFNVVGFYLLQKHDWYNIITYCLIYGMTLILSPIITLYNGGIMSAGALIFVIIMAVIFMLMEGMVMYITILIVIFEHALIFSRLYYEERLPFVNSTANDIIINYFIAFVSTGIIIVAIILRQRKNYNFLNQRVEESREIVKHVEQAKGRFLSSMSQEIRTPMNVIVGIAEIMQSDNDENIKREMQTIKTAGYDLLSVIDDVLKYSNLDTGKYNVIQSDYLFENLIHNILDSISIDLEQKNLKLDVRIAHNIPRVVKGDMSSIRQIFLYLLFVSLSMTTEGRILLHIDVDNDYDTGKSTFKCTIADTGRGLSKIDVDSLFGSYQTYDSRQSSDLKGIGLKFVICKEMLKLMGGDIEVKAIERVGMSTTFSYVNEIVDRDPMIQVNLEKAPSLLIYLDEEAENINWKEILDGFGINIKYVGTRYYFKKAVEEKKYDYIFLTNDRYEEVETIISKFSCEEYTYVIGEFNHNYGDFGKCRLLRRPLSCIDIAEVLNQRWEQKNYSREQNTNQFMAPNAKVLVVDDNAVNLKVAAGIFGKFGINISVATSGEMALSKMEKEVYDLVLMDMIMPELTGEETLNIIRSRADEYFQNVPVVALTASTGGDLKDSLIEAGFQEYLAKPIKMRYLSKCLLEFLPRKKIQYKDDISIKDMDRQMPEKGLFVQKGMSSIGVGEDAYLTILNTYYIESKNNMEILPRLLEENDISLFTTYVHGIKSSSASLGAFYVSVLFKELEALGKNNNVNEIRKKLPIYLDELAEVLDEAKLYLQNMGRYIDKSDAQGPTGVVQSLDMEMLSELRVELNKMNLKACDEMVRELANINYGEEANEQIRKMINSYEKFDFHGAKEALSKLLPGE